MGRTNHLSLAERLEPETPPKVIELVAECLEAHATPDACDRIIGRAVVAAGGVPGGGEELASFLKRFLAQTVEEALGETVAEVVVEELTELLRVPLSVAPPPVISGIRPTARTSVAPTQSRRVTITPAEWFALEPPRSGSSEAPRATTLSFGVPREKTDSWFEILPVERTGMQQAARAPRSRRETLSFEAPPLEVVISLDRERRRRRGE